MSNINKELEEERVRWPAKKKYPCKRGKGPHQFEMVEEEYFKSWYKKGKTARMRNYVCTACGKKDTDIDYVDKE